MLCYEKKVRGAMNDSSTSPVFMAVLHLAFPDGGKRVKIRSSCELVTSAHCCLEEGIGASSAKRARCTMQTVWKLTDGIQAKAHKEGMVCL